MVMTTMAMTTIMKTVTVTTTTAMTTTINNKTVCQGGPHHEHVCVGVSEGAEVGHGVLNERSKDKAEADTQVNIDGLNEAVGIG